jgi:hypothetical protein
LGLPLPLQFAVPLGKKEDTLKNYPLLDVWKDGRLPRAKLMQVRVATAWKPGGLRECGVIPPVLASLQAAIAKRAAEWLRWHGRVAEQIENPD